MASVEAAASLFGPEDPASDPFASFVSSPENDATVQQKTEDLFAAHDTSAGLDFFQSDANSSSFPAVQENEAVNSDPYAAWPEPTAAQDFGYNSDPYSQDQNLGASYSQLQQGTYDEHGQWHESQQHVSESVLTRKSLHPSFVLY